MRTQRSGGPSEKGEEGNAIWEAVFHKGAQKTPDCRKAPDGEKRAIFPVATKEPEYAAAKGRLIVV